METNRQKKIAGVLQKDIAEVISQALRDSGKSNVMVSVTKVTVTTDLSVSKVYMSVFPYEEAANILTEVRAVGSQIKHQVALKTKNQLRRMPDLEYFVDDSLEHIEKLNQAIKGEENPILDRDLLDRRKKI